MASNCILMCLEVLALHLVKREFSLPAVRAFAQAQQAQSLKRYLELVLPMPQLLTRHAVAARMLSNKGRRERPLTGRSERKTPHSHMTLQSSMTPICEELFQHLLV